MDLHQVLRSFCVKTGWCYAIFWKLECGGFRALTWEDGFYLSPPDIGHLHGNTGDSESEASNPEKQIQITIAKMSSCVYSVGEGIIGQVAFTGKSQWLFADGDRFSGRSAIMHEKYPSCWDAQFAAGIKTILIIAVPQGVVQLGSTHRLTEDIEWTNYVKSAFGNFQNMSPMYCSDSVQGVKVGKTVDHRLNSHSAFVEVERPNNSKCLTTENYVGISYLMPQDSNTMRVDDIGVERKKHKSDTVILEPSSSVLHADMVSNVSQCTPLSTQNMTTNQNEEVRTRHLEDDSVHESLIAGLKKILGSEIDMNGLMYLENNGFPGDRLDINQLNVDELLYKIILDSKRSVSTSFVKGHNLQHPKLALNYNPNIPVTASRHYNIQDIPHRNRNAFSLIGRDTGNHESSFGLTSDDVSQSTCYGGGSDPNNNGMIVHSESTGCKNDDSFGCMGSTYNVQGKSFKRNRPFMIGDELSEALGPAFKPAHEKDLWNDGLKKIETSDYLLEPTIFEKEYWCIVESESQSLLDAVVANASSSHHSVTTADDSFSCKTMSGVSSQMPAERNAVKESVIKHEHARCSSVIKASPSDCSGDTQNTKKRIKDPISLNSSVDGLKSVISSRSDDMQSMKSDSTQSSQSKKPDDFNKVTRKRARPGESTRPRPKDRQQIQDRVRELREIIPNGSKCSIDALLEKTIKHMIFLQNVTLHVDNLKKNGELRDGMESGASCAFELCGEETSYPILVKNLNQPRQFLVEMFCEEWSQFFEIADVIRSLGLFILKGVMESHSDKMWARFIVEANRDIRRVDITMSLMHLVHNNDNSMSSMTMASQSAQLRSQQTADSTSSSQTETVCGLQQASLLS